MSSSKSSTRNRRRKGDAWVSTNRHLIGHTKKVIGRNPNFDTDETKLLIRLWGDPKTQKLLITTHKKHLVIKNLADKMREYGYHRSVEEVTTRIKNLKCFYNRLKKDYGTGVCTEVPVWKHFEAMDAIMTRRIFSVRPNEIAQPSLRYRLEEEQSERKQHRADNPRIFDFTKDVRCNGISSGSNGGIDDGIIPDAEVDIDINDNAFAVLNSAHMIQQKKRDDEKYLKIKETESSHSSNIIEAELNTNLSLTTPKEEPIDVDDYKETNTNNHDRISDTENGALTPNLSEYIQNSNTFTAEIEDLQANTCPEKTMKQISIDKNAFVLANGKCAMKNITRQNGKISFIPTNFLIQNNLQHTQPFAVNSKQFQKSQHRFLYTQSIPKSSIGTVPAAASGVKVLLVNAADKSESQNRVLTSKSCLQKAMTNQFLHQSQLTHHEINSNHKIKSAGDLINGDNAYASNEGLELQDVINTLILVQKETNNIQRQQLELDFQRLKFQKSIAERVLSAMHSLFTLKSKNVSATETQNQAPSEVNTGQVLDGLSLLSHNRFHILTPKVESLLFA